MDKLTDEQIREFWERLDCLEIKKFPTTHPLLGSGVVMIDSYVWKPTGQRLGHQLGSCTFPEPDLNNLFRWAMPKLESWDCVIDWAIEMINAYADGRTLKDPALALFWAIYKALEVIDGNDTNG